MATDAGELMLLVAIGCGRLPALLDAAGRHPIVVLGTMDGESLAGLARRVSESPVPSGRVFFYETG